MTGSLYKRGNVWWMAYMVNGRQRCESTKTANKTLAAKILNLRVARIIEGRFQLPNSNPPRLQQFSQHFLGSIRHQNTKKRYATSVANLHAHFGDCRLSDFNLEHIEQFKKARLSAEVRAATVNRDLAVLRNILKIAERKRLITTNLFREVELLEERKERRQPHILSFAEEERLLAVCPEHLRVLVIVILDTGLRSGKEALSIKWDAIDFASGVIRIKTSNSSLKKRVL
jgi:site-specific recombinase XerD